MHHAIEYIEENLHQPLSLDNVAQQCGFSKYHFHRIFQSCVGSTVTEYIRMRRLANASAALLYTNKRILDILSIINLARKNPSQEHLKKCTSFHLEHIEK